MVRSLVVIAAIVVASALIVPTVSAASVNSGYGAAKIAAS
jgi:hypothetical protein